MRQRRRQVLIRPLLLFLLFQLNLSLLAQPELGQCDQEIDEKVAAQIPRAQSAWQKGNYREAERYLMRAVNLNEEYADALYLLAELMLRKKELLKAEALYAKLYEVCPDYKPEVAYFLGLMYLERGRLAEAITLIQTFLDNPERSFGLDEEAKQALVEAKLRQRLFNNPVDFDPQPVEEVSTPADEYLATISPDQRYLFFTRRSRKKQRRDGPAARVRMVEEFSRAQRLPNGKFSRGEPLASPFNQNFNEGGPSITADNTELYFTVCQNLDGYRNCDIYYAEQDEFGYWTTPRSIGDHINRRDTWESQPSVSAEGKALYFASNRDGGYGELDLYVVERLPSGDWSKPRNLGPEINTKRNEKTPFIHSDSQTLYFTSDGHPGLGGFDVFYAKQLSDSLWDEPVNIGYPINGKNDDLGLFVSLDGRTAYFASNKINDQNGWDLFSFTLPVEARPQEVALISGTVKREGIESDTATRIQIRNLRTREVTEIKADAQTGRYAKVVNVDREPADLIVSVKKRGAAFSSRYISGDSLQSGGVSKAKLRLASLEVGREYTLNDIRFASNSYALDEVARRVIDEFVLYLKDNPGLSADIQGHTDNVGDDQSNLTLSRQRAKSVYDYVVSQGVDPQRLSHHGYGEQRPIESNASEKGRAQNRRTVFVVTAN